MRLSRVIVVSALAACSWEPFARATEIHAEPVARRSLTIHGPRPREGFVATARTGVTVGDLNGDGSPDMVFGFPFHTDHVDERGRIEVVFGPFPDGQVRDLAVEPAELVILGREPEGHYGWDAEISDLNGDGANDLVTGSRCGSRPDSFRTCRGEVQIFYGPLASGIIDLTLIEPDVALIGPVETDGFGTILLVADFGNDGVLDIATAGPYGNTGNVRVLRGPFPPGPPRVTAPGEFDLTFRTSEAGVLVGEQLLAADVSGDGLLDLIISAQEADDFAGKVFVYFGGWAPGTVADLETSPPDVVIRGEPRDFLGTSIAATDLDGDAVAELLVAAPFADGPGNAYDESGEVGIFHGPLTPGERGLGTAETVLFNRSRALLGNHAAAASHAGRGTFAIKAQRRGSICEGPGEIFLLEQIPPPGLHDIYDLDGVAQHMYQPSLTSHYLSFANIRGDSAPELLITADSNGPAGDRPRAGQLLTIEQADACERTPAPFDHDDLKVRREGDDILLELPGEGLVGNVGADIYRGELPDWFWYPNYFDPTRVPGGCGVQTLPHRLIGDAAEGAPGFYYVATRACPNACDPERTHSGLGSTSDGPRFVHPRAGDACP